MSMMSGLLNNILITAGSCILPMVVGIAVCVVCNKNQSLSKIAHIFGAFFESFCPIVTIVFLFYCVFGQLQLNRIVICIIGFSISFMGYMPLRYEPKNSMLKNLAVNGLGLVSTAFKWSFAAGWIAVADLLKFASMQMAKTYDVASFVIVFFISFVIVFALEMIKVFVNEKL
jgi:ABC-type arginine/histidine transport system permease subunit